MQAMKMTQNVSLRTLSTMRLGGSAAYVAEITDRHEISEAVSWAEAHGLPLLMIGNGSNIIWRDEGFNGLLLVNRIKQFEEQFEDDENYYVTIGAGEDWDAAVAKTVTQGMTGIEALSLIPGTAGGTPVQNVGAYGQDISQTLVSVEAYDIQTKQFVTIPKDECAFDYRTSRFKTGDHGRFFIVSITLHLIHGNPKPPFYPALQSYLDERGVVDPTPQQMRDAVIAIRRAKLPDPAQVANNGSFFRNPLIGEARALELLAAYPNMPHWPADNGVVKVAAAWLIEQIGFKGIHDDATGMAIWPTQPLVLVNEHAQHTADLIAFRQKILDAVQAKFGIALEQEPELLP